MSDRPRTPVEKAIARLTCIRSDLEKINKRGGISPRADNHVCEALSQVRAAIAVLEKE